jgi:hypothetical protein
VLSILVFCLRPVTGFAPRTHASVKNVAAEQCIRGSRVYHYEGLGRPGLPNSSRY